MKTLDKKKTRRVLTLHAQDKGKEVFTGIRIEPGCDHAVAYYLALQTIGQTLESVEDSKDLGERLLAIAKDFDELTARLRGKAKAKRDAAVTQALSSLQLPEIPEA